MKTIKELQSELTLNIGEQASHVRQLKRTSIDWDVYLPTFERNLQRDFVWSLEQKRTLIESILIGRHIPHLAIINTHLPNSTENHYLIIDGKQRLSAIFDFIDDKFTIILEGQEFLFSDLPEDYQLEIVSKPLRFYSVNEEYNKPTSDLQKYLWFKRLNFGGTPQDEEHLNSFVIGGITEVETENINEQFYYKLARKQFEELDSETSSLGTSSEKVYKINGRVTRKIKVWSAPPPDYFHYNIYHV